MTLPTTPRELYVWNAALLAVYVLSALALDLAYRRLFGFRDGTGMGPTDFLFNGATFSASVIIGLAIYDEQVLKLVGDTTGYLILAGAAGILYSLNALRPKPNRRGLSG